MVACLLFLLLVVGAIDQVPDPPAINPHNSGNGKIFALHAHGFSAPQQEALLSSDLSHYVRTSFSPVKLTIKTKVLGPSQSPVG
jgi:hypothetical protein